jgi:hypothetical protein
MTLQMFDVEIDNTELEDFVLVEYPVGFPVECDSDTRIDIPVADFVEVVALEEDETVELVTPMRTFQDCPPLAVAGLFCALLSFVAFVLYWGLVVVLPFWMTGRL